MRCRQVAREDISVCDAWAGIGFRDFAFTRPRASPRSDLDPGVRHFFRAGRCRNEGLASKSFDLPSTATPITLLIANVT